MTEMAPIKYMRCLLSIARGVPVTMNVSMSIGLSILLTMIVLDGTHSLGLTARGRCIMSEAPHGNRPEQIAIGFACERNPNHASGKFPNAAVTRLAQDIGAHRISDPTQGANRWYSPESMPKEADKVRCTKPVGSGAIDCSGGLESVCGTTKNYKPGWAAASKQVNMSGVRHCNFKFFKL